MAHYLHFVAKCIKLTTYHSNAVVIPTWIPKCLGYNVLAVISHALAAYGSDFRQDFALKTSQSSCWEGPASIIVAILLPLTASRLEDWSGNGLYKTFTCPLIGILESYFVYHTTGIYMRHFKGKLRVRNSWQHQNNLQELAKLREVWHSIQEKLIYGYLALARKCGR